MAIDPQEIANKIRSIAEKSKSEADLEIEVESLLSDVIHELGLKVQAEHEKTIFKSKRADAVYPAIVIEYKKPGTLKSKPVFERAKNELGYYLKGMAKGEKIPRKYVGVGLDGKNIFFLRSKKMGKRKTPKKQVQKTLFGEVLEEIPSWDIQGPMLVNKGSIQLLLVFLRGLSRKILTADNLADDFGSKSSIGRSSIKILYKRLIETKNPKVKMLFGEWKRIFGIIYGKDLSKAKKDLKQTVSLYALEGKIELQELLFTIHSYFALLMKLVAAEVLSLREGALIGSLASQLSTKDDQQLRNNVEDLEAGGLFKRLGIKNFLEGNFFSWYVNEWDEEIANIIRVIAQCLSNYEPSTTTLESSEAKDLLKKLYQYLVPKTLRHDLGEYYTPDWLAELVLDELEYYGDPSKRILDPACGSGTFLVLILDRIKRRVKDNPELYPNKQNLLSDILNNVVGFDINPLAVLASRTNYLIAIAEYLRIGEIEIPVYLCDSVLAPEEYASVYGKSYRIRTAVGNFLFPTSFVKRKVIDEILGCLDEIVELKGSRGETLFLEKIKKAVHFEITKEDNQALQSLYKKIAKLEKEGRNRIWTNIIRNNFAPLYVGKFDFVAGNPPWIRWGFLSDQYREATNEMWKDYGLFSLKGMAARLGGGEKDFSMLFTYASTEFYLKDNQNLGFLITQEVFKSKGAGEGFRRFRIGEKTPFKVLKVHDLVKVKPFEGAANKTCMIILKRGEETAYPLPYVLWKPKQRIKPNFSLEKAKELTSREELMARPIDDSTGSWLTVGADLARKSNLVLGKSNYKAYRGASVDPYGVYFVKIKYVRPDGKIIVENEPELGKKSIEKVEMVIEPDLVFPALRGSDIHRWKLESKYFVIIPQDPTKRVGYPEDWMIKKLPDTYRYFCKFKSQLLQKALYWKYFSRNLESKSALSNTELSRKGKYYRFRREAQKGNKKVWEYQFSNAPFYTIFNIGAYSFSHYKVLWSRMASDLKAVVCTPQKSIIGKKIAISTDTTAFVSLSSEAEAHYLCALLNSNLVRDFVKSFSSAGRGFGAPSILKHIRIPRYSKNDQNHNKIVQLSKKAHKLASINYFQALASVENKIDESILSVFNDSKTR